MSCCCPARLQFVFNVLLLNVLIASMTNSLSKITQVRHSSRLGVLCCVSGCHPRHLLRQCARLMALSRKIQISGSQGQQHAWMCVSDWWRLLCLQDEGLRLLHSKAEIIDELEATLPQWVRSHTWYPAFVHILKIHPDATYEVSALLGGWAQPSVQAGRQPIKLCREWWLLLGVC